MQRYFLSTVLCVALLLTSASPALAWKMEKQDLSQIEVTFDPAVDPANRPSEWAKSELEAAAEAGLIPEDMSGDVKLQNAITREQFAELAVNLTRVIYGEGPDILLAKTFTDCDNLQVRLASAAGIVDGVGGGRFDPTATTNREQIASMLYRAIVYLEKSMDISVLSTPADISAFSDKDQVSNWAAAGVGTLAANGIMKGSGSTVLPQSPCTIEQSILLCYRIYTIFFSRMGETA